MLSASFYVTGARFPGNEDYCACQRGRTCFKKSGADTLLFTYIIFPHWVSFGIVFPEKPADIAGVDPNAVVFIPQKIRRVTNVKPIGSLLENGSISLSQRPLYRRYKKLPFLLHLPISLP